MPTLLVRFPGRRYHATPWGNHVNEGQIEWPPSPWRIIRALLSVGYAKEGWDCSGPPPVACSLFAKLAEALPVYSLPSAVGAHSRHFMPLAKFKDGRESTTLVFDTWARIDDGILAVTWNVELHGEETALLAVLASKLGYLGRSESWVEARLANMDESLPKIDCFPSDDPPEPGREQVLLIAPLNEKDFMEWRQKAVETALKDMPDVAISKKPDKKLLEKRKKEEEAYPASLIGAMQSDTTWLRNHGWSQPPGSRRVFYHRRSDSLKIGAITKDITPVIPPVKAMLLAMATGSGNKHALPPVIHTLIHGERLHKALVGMAGQHNAALCGCDSSGNSLKGRHEHAHFIPLDLDNDGHLDHFIVWAPMGLDGAAQQAVRAIRKTFAKGVDSLRLALSASCAELNELNSLPGQHGESLSSILGLSGSRHWISHTPFVPPRHLKPRGKNSLEGQIAAELKSRGFPSAEVQVLDPRDNPAYLRHRHFRRIRKDGPCPPVDFGFTVALQFDRQITGPLCLGYGSHFGLGLFAAM